MQFYVKLQEQIFDSKKFGGHLLFHIEKKLYLSVDNMSSDFLKNLQNTNRRILILVYFIIHNQSMLRKYNTKGKNIVGTYPEVQDNFLIFLNGLNTVFP